MQERVKGYRDEVLIGELARKTGLSDRTIRFYEKQGLLPEPPRTSGGYRRYGPDAVTRLAFVRAAQTAGLTLAEIRGVMEIRDRGQAPCVHVEMLIEGKLEEIGRRMRELRSTRESLMSLRRRAEALDPSTCREDGICQILSPGRSGESG